MPGSNHDVDVTFMDSLPFAVREAALDLIRFASLKEMLEYYKDGPSEFLQNSFNLSPDQWNLTLRAVILTKISYFDLQLHFPNRYIDKLIEIASAVTDRVTADPVGLYHSMEAEHPKFADWIKKAMLVKKQNLKFAQAQVGQA